jgi:class 3 adenylate cyclase
VSAVRSALDQTANERGGAPCLCYQDELGAERVFVLHGEQPLTIGRGEGADLRLPGDRSVSLLHAQLIRLGGHWLIADDGVSRNGTFVNGERLYGRRRLRQGDAVRVGATTLAFSDAAARPRDATTISDGPSASGTVTLLFTDLVGSTELLARLGERAYEAARREHFALLRAAAGEHGGREVKSLGDGLMVAFSSARGAAACAVGMQRRIAARGAAREAPALALRVGLNAGEVIGAEDDYFGAPVVVAARLCDRAGAGKILASGVVRALVGEWPEQRFLPAGAMALKGFSEPVAAFELEWGGDRDGERS